MDYFTAERLCEVSAFIEALKMQDDRSCAIMIAARLEFLLRRAIEARLLEPRSKSKDTVKRLQFSGCVELCFRLGLIHQTHADALDALAGIRNKAAHFDEPMALNSETFRQYVSAFASPWKADRSESHFHNLYQEELTRSDSPERAIFVVTASVFFVFYSPLAHVTNKLAPIRVVDQMPSVA